jgi:hypothetical protein
MSETKPMWRMIVPTHGGPKSVYYTTDDSRTGECLGIFDTVIGAEMITGRKYVGETIDTMYDRDGKRKY